MRAALKHIVCVCVCVCVFVCLCVCVCVCVEDWVVADGVWAADADNDIAAAAIEEQAGDAQAVDERAAGAAADACGV